MTIVREIECYVHLLHKIGYYYAIHKSNSQYIDNRSVSVNVTNVRVNVSLKGKFNVKSTCSYFGLNNKKLARLQYCKHLLVIYKV